MSLARVKVWNPGDVLTASDLNAEFNNVLNNPVSLISPSTGPINFNLQAHTNLVPSAITASSGLAGQALIASTAATPATIWGMPPKGSKVKGLNMVGSSQNAQFTAQEYVFNSTALSQSFVTQTTAAFTVNLNTAGPAANGRDQAGSFASTYLHYYAITTGAGSTAIAGTVSSQPPSLGPTLPSGYAGYAYLTSLIYSSASTSINNVRQRGSWVWNDNQQTLVSNGQSTTLVSVSFAAQVPSIADNTFLGMDINNQAGTLSTMFLQAVSGTNTMTFRAPSGFPYSITIQYPNSTTLQYLWSTNPNPGGLFIYTNAYSVPNGDAA